MLIDYLNLCDCGHMKKKKWKKFTSHYPCIFATKIKTNHIKYAAISIIMTQTKVL